MTDFSFYCSFFCILRWNGEAFNQLVPSYIAFKVTVIVSRIIQWIDYDANSFHQKHFHIQRIYSYLVSSCFMLPFLKLDVLYTIHIQRCSSVHFIRFEFKVSFCLSFEIMWYFIWYVAVISIGTVFLS